jgi:iron complex outermembrane receptor protein
MNFAYEKSDSYRDYANNDKKFFAPIIKWELSPQTRATFELEYQDWDTNMAATLPLVGGKLYPFSASTNLATPNTSYNQGSRVLGGVNWSHDFTKDWVFSHAFQVNSINRNYQMSYINPANATGITNNRQLFNGVDNARTYFNNLNLSGKFKTGALKHTSLFGFDYFRLNNSLDELGYSNTSAFNVFSPDYYSGFYSADPANNFKRNSNIDWYGLYYQDQIELPYNFHALAGIRYDASKDTNNITSKVSDKDKVSPRGGLVWRPIEELSLYGSYTENFGATNNFDSQGNALAPQTAQQWEVGTKTEFFDGRLSGTIAYYDLKKQNIAYIQSPGKFSTIGAAETRGIEFDIQGEVLPGLKLIGGYSYMPFAKITQDNFAKTGKRLPLAPTNSGSLWGTYEFKYGDLQGLKFGAGMTAVTQRQANPINSYQLPGYATLNLLTSYSHNIGKAKITTQFNVDNLLDKTYYTSNGGVEISPLATRMLYGSIRVEY